MKKFLSGFLAGAILFGAIGVFAATYTAGTADFKIFVNGKEFTSDPTPVVIEGRTFLPLRAIGDALGVKVEWNEELRQVEVGEPPAQAYSRSNPAPIGTAQTFEGDTVGLFAEGGKVEITVTEVIRGKEAEERIVKANAGVNQKPKDGYEYALAKVKMKVLETKKDVITITSAEFDAYSDDEETPDNFSSAPTPKFAAKAVHQLKPGEADEGFIVVLVKKDDAEPKLVYSFNENGGIWFKLY